MLTEPRSDEMAAIIWYHHNSSATIITLLGQSSHRENWSSLVTTNKHIPRHSGHWHCHSILVRAPDTVSESALSSVASTAFIHLHPSRTVNLGIASIHTIPGAEILNKRNQIWTNIFNVYCSLKFASLDKVFESHKIFLFTQLFPRRQFWEFLWRHEPFMTFYR